MASITENICNMEIKLPRTIKELRLQHLEAVAKLNPSGLDAYDKLVLVNELTGIDTEILRRVSLKDLDAIIKQYFTLITSCNEVNPPKEIEVNGKKFKLIKSVSEMPLAWHIDLNHFDVKDAAVVAAFCYIEKGMSYCELDKQSNVLNPLANRIELFREYLSADVYIALSFFFQKKLKDYTNAYTEIQKQRKLMEA